MNLLPRFLTSFLTFSLLLLEVSDVLDINSGHINVELKVYGWQKQIMKGRIGEYKIGKPSITGWEDVEKELDNKELSEA